ncbi:adenine deaminase C-terminal domain-containing protein [Alkalihalobacillus sp. AL-G]|uniref:adenine deaminase C-terminal domain-containing protein n=1 Tax=Alkalihalobacillus sp. AL-G TaxID=2926399 RepID=UPI00272C5284|nr:adenine deaminase C-terminal domain-containing protein [Alkalihalobacillus sp. AL-G]WLD93741.1 amidohydrolase family protein [Alkalihalobacillus sp. AL-G]
MTQHITHWTKQQLRTHLQVIQGDAAPTLVLKNATYLNHGLKQWLTANIWIYEDRIVYVGSKMPRNNEGCEFVDCENQFVVPGYIEPHAHPFQLYNPHTFARYSAKRGTMTFVNDNLMLLPLSNEKALSFMTEINQLPYSFFWWCRYDSQTKLQNESEVFSDEMFNSFLNHPYVVQGGELTSWPAVLKGDDQTLHWMQETKRRGLKVEGHLPGASERTLTKMAVLGIDCDHEAMTGEEAVRRMTLGYTTSLRYSSIRPDLPEILEEMLSLGVRNFERVLMTSDGSTPNFYKDGVTDAMIRIAIEKGVPIEDAYAMASYNVARHYGMDHLYGMIAPGRLANLNILEDQSNPTPTAVLSKGIWISDEPEETFDWDRFDIKPYDIDWNLSVKDLHVTSPVGINMVNAVITKPYRSELDNTGEELSAQHDECFFSLIDKNGSWHVNTMLKGFATGVSGFVSSYSNSGDIILIGKRKKDMITAFERMKELGGGIVLVESGEIVCEVPLTLNGGSSIEPMEEIMKQQSHLVSSLKERGYAFVDPIYSLLFFSSTHLPYIRITPSGMVDVMKNEVLFPVVMR